MREIEVITLGLPVAYGEMLARQKERRALVERGDAPNTLFVLEHLPVITCGRNTQAGNVLAAPVALAAQGVALESVDRGGDVTYHGPGQLVAYPIVDLKRHKQDLHWYLRQVEESVIRGLDALGLASTRVDGLTGVWRVDGHGQRKLASIGVHARDWVTWHGVALNVSNTLATFDHTVPCGIDGVTMTTVTREFERLGLPGPTFEAVQLAIVAGFADVFALDVVPLATGLSLSAGN